MSSIRNFPIYGVYLGMCLLLFSCENVDLNYGGIDCGSTALVNDTCHFTDESYTNSYTGNVGHVAGMCFAVLKCVQTNFCPLDSICARVDFRIKSDTADIYALAYISAGRDTSFLKLDWEPEDNIDHYSGSGWLLPKKNNNAENYTVFIELMFSGRGEYLQNVEFLQRIFIEGTVITTYSKKLE